MAGGAGLCIWTIVEITGVKEEETVMETILKLGKMDNIIFLLIKESEIFSVKDQIVNSFSFVDHTAFATITPLFHKAALDKNTWMGVAVF